MYSCLGLDIDLWAWFKSPQHESGFSSWVRVRFLLRAGLVHASADLDGDAFRSAARLVRELGDHDVWQAANTQQSQKHMKNALFV